MKVVINRCYGGFSLSNEAVLRYAELKGINLVENKKDKSFLGMKSWYIDGIEDDDHYFSSYSIDSAYSNPMVRADKDLVQVVEEMGDAANGRCAELAIVEVPDDAKWHIAEYDGYEHVAEDHRTWG